MTTSRVEAAREERAASASLASQLAELEDMTTAELAQRFTEVYGYATRTRNSHYLRRRIAWKLQADAEGGLSQRALDRIDCLAPLAHARWRLRPSPAKSPTATAGRPGAPPARAVEPVAALPGRPRDPRLPTIGTVLTRVYGCAEHRVTVLADGFSYDGKTYRSLSAVACAIAGTRWNGYGFFEGALRDAAAKAVA